jgi:histidyl-tRNA synthetase
MAIAKELLGPPRGMRDLLPGEVALRDRVAAAILATYEAWGYRHVETPALEHIRNLTAGQGGDNEKLIFKILKRGEEIADWSSAGSLDALVDHGLRFDLTVPLVRYYAHNRAKLPRLFKAIQIGPVWRAERPQRGRFRQFVQCDIDVIGSTSPLVEVELCAASAAALIVVGFRGFIIRLNDRRILEAMARGCGFAPERHAQVFITIDKLDKIGREGVRAELTEHGHDAAAVTALDALLADLPVPSAEVLAHPIARAATGEDRKVFEDLAGVARAVEQDAKGAYRVVFDPTLVRGMGYYTGTVFEIAYKDYPFSIAGGGRYDKMIGRLIGLDVPACGFSIGFERVVTILAEEGAANEAARRIALIVDDGVDPGRALAEAGKLRADGQAVTLLAREKNLGQQIKALSADGYDRFAILRAAGLGALESTATPAPAS